MTGEVSTGATAPGASAVCPGMAGALVSRSPRHKNTTMMAAIATKIIAGAKLFRVDERRGAGSPLSTLTVFLGVGSRIGSRRGSCFGAMTCACFCPIRGSRPALGLGPVRPLPRPTAGVCASGEPAKLACSAIATSAPFSYRCSGLRCNIL